MTALYLKVEVFGGASIEAAAGEACVLAGELGITVEFHFNGVMCMANPGGSSGVLIENWRAAVDGGGLLPMATTNRREVSASAEQK